MKKAVGEKMPLPPKTEGPKKYTPKIQEVEIKGETSWGGETPERLKSKLAKQLLKSKLESRMLQEKIESGKSDWMDKFNLKGAKETIAYSREQLKKK